MQPKALPHIKVLSKYCRKISIEAKKLKKKEGIIHCKARERWIFENTPFSGSNEYDQWLNKQEKDLSVLAADQERLFSLNYQNALHNNVLYFAFRKEIKLTCANDEVNSLIISPSEVTESVHSFILEKQIWPNMVVRRPIPVISPMSFVKCANNEGRTVYIINTFTEYLNWSKKWGGEALISLDVFQHENFNIDEKEALLSDFIAVK